MARVLGIDFGEKRIGIAISDPLGRIAVPLPTLARSDDRSAITALAELIETEGVELVVLGEPKNLDGRAGSAAERVRRFGDKLAKRTGRSIQFVNEALTSREAEGKLREAGVDPRKHPDRVDAISAQLLLQEALDHRVATG